MMYSRALSLILVMLYSLMTGCATAPQQRPNYRPTQPVISQAPPISNGSIYQSGYEVRLFEDMKARRMGDVLTIVLQERTQASKSAKTETTKETDITMPSPSLMGVTPSFSPYNLSNNVSSAQDFTGEGDASQSNSLTGNITVTISEVLPNGNLVVRGEKWLTLNQGEEYIQISGIIRPQDISPNNTIVSTLVADARITYSGEGSIANSQRQGWLGNFFASAIWPF